MSECKGEECAGMLSEEDTGRGSAEHVGIDRRGEEVVDGEVSGCS